MKLESLSKQCKYLSLLIALFVFAAYPAKAQSPVKIEVWTTYSTTDEALVVAKTALMGEKFINEGGIQNNAFTAKRTTNSHADYYIADVTALNVDGKVKVIIAFIKAGSGLLKLDAVASKIKTSLSASSPSFAPSDGIPRASASSDKAGKEKAIGWLIKNTKEVTVEGTTYLQTIERDSPDDYCKVKLLTSDKTSKSSGATEVFTFHLKDLDEASVTFHVKGTLLLVEAKTNFRDARNRQLVIHRTKNGQVLNYGYQLRIIVESTEKGQNYVEALKQAIELCKESKKSWMDE